MDRGCQQAGFGPHLAPLVAWTFLPGAAWTRHLAACLSSTAEFGIVGYRGRGDAGTRNVTERWTGLSAPASWARTVKVYTAGGSWSAGISHR